MTWVAIATLLTGLLIFGISLPLINRKIPMNHSYGIRIPAAFESEQRWYDINAYGGRKMAAWSWVITAAGIAGLLVPKQHSNTYFIANVVVTLLAVLIPVVQVYLWSRKK